MKWIVGLLLVAACDPSASRAPSSEALPASAPAALPARAPAPPTLGGGDAVAPSPLSIGTINGPTQIGNDNRQYNSFVTPRWAVPPQAKRDELIAHLKALPPKKFVLSFVTDDRASDVGNALYADLLKAGWTSEVGALTALAFNGDPPRGLIIEATQASPASDYLNAWCRGAGLPAGVFADLKAPVDVKITVGRFPDRSP